MTYTEDLEKRIEQLEGLLQGNAQAANDIISIATQQVKAEAEVYYDCIINISATSKGIVVDGFNGNIENGTIICVPYEMCDCQEDIQKSIKEQLKYCE